jgi:hypothetical protein
MSRAGHTSSAIRLSIRNAVAIDSDRLAARRDDPEVLLIAKPQDATVQQPATSA